MREISLLKSLSDQPYFVKILDVINKQVHPGLKWAEEEKRDEFEFDEIPGLREAGWTKKSYELAK
jgi:hypothetical protein